MKETNKARQAFEDYYNMGPARSLRLLHKEYCQRTEIKPPTKRFETLAHWSTTHGWQNRVAERDKEIADATLADLKEKATKTGYAIYQQRIRDLGVLAIRMFNLMKTGALQPQYIREYRGLLSDIAAEMGERRKEHKIQIDVDRKFRELLEEHGLTYEDIRTDPLLSSLFIGSGIPIVGIASDEASSGSETTETD